MLLQVAKFHSFLWLSSNPLCVCVCVCVYHSLFIHSSVDDCGFLMSGVCPLVGEAGPQATVGFLEGRVRAQGSLGLVPSHW